MVGENITARDVWLAITMVVVGFTAGYGTYAAIMDATGQEKIQKGSYILKQDLDKSYVPKSETQEGIPSAGARAFDRLATEVRLDGTTWQGEYEDVGEEGLSTTRLGYVDFHQDGSRIVGEGRDKDRRWLIEGIAYKSRICYIYVDSDPNVVSIGTATFQLDASGKRLNGQWIGWAPDGTRLEPRRITLTRVNR
jgi:hypothetical protein